MSGLLHGLEASPQGDALLRPGKDYELQESEIVVGGDTARIAELEEALRSIVVQWEEAQAKKHLGRREASYITIPVNNKEMRRIRKVLDHE